MGDGEPRRTKTTSFMRRWHSLHHRMLDGFLVFQLRSCGFNFAEEGNMERNKGFLELQTTDAKTTSRPVREMSVAAVADRTRLWRLPLNLLRSFSSSSTAPPSSPSTTNSVAAKKKLKRGTKKNLFEVGQFLPNWGVGYHMAKAHWTNVSYEITKINLYKDGRHGKAWGLAYKDGIPAEAPKKISGVHKRCWKYMQNPKKAEPEITPEAQAA